MEENSQFHDPGLHNINKGKQKINANFLPWRDYSRRQHRQQDYIWVQGVRILDAGCAERVVCVSERNVSFMGLNVLLPMIICDLHMAGKRYIGIVLAIDIGY